MGEQPMPPEPTDDLDYEDWLDEWIAARDEAADRKHDEMKEQKWEK